MSIMDLGIAGVAAIIVICFLVCQLVKATPLDTKWLPVISGVAGGLLGIVALRAMPGYPVEDVITAIAIGIVSGLSATGINQIYKQLSSGATAEN